MWFDSSVGRALHRHRRGRGFESRSEPKFFSGLCSSSVAAALALMIVITQLLLMDKIHFMEKRAENTTRSGVFLKKFEMFGNIFKHCLSV